MNSKFPKIKSKTLLVLELSPLRVRAAIVRRKGLNLEFLQTVEKTGLDESEALDAALTDLRLSGRLPGEAVLVSSLALPALLPSLPDADLPNERREEMLRWELEPQLNSLLFAPGPSTLLHWQGKWKSENSQSMLGVTAGLQSLNSTQWRAGMVASGAVTQEELDYLNLVIDHWPTIPSPCGVSAVAIPGGAVALAWSNVQVAAINQHLERHNSRLVGILPLAGCGWSLIPAMEDCRVLERLPGQFLLSTFKQGRPSSLTWHQYHADGIPESIFRELNQGGARRVLVVDSLGTGDALRQELENYGIKNFEVKDFPEGSLRAAAALALGLGGPVQPASAGLSRGGGAIKPAQLFLVASLLIAAGSFGWTAISTKKEKTELARQLFEAQQTSERITQLNAAKAGVRREHEELGRRHAELRGLVVPDASPQSAAPMLRDRSQDFAAVLVECGFLGSELSLKSLVATPGGGTVITGNCRSIPALQQACADLNRGLAQSRIPLSFKAEAETSGGRTSFTLTSETEK